MAPLAGRFKIILLAVLASILAIVYGMRPVDATRQIEFNRDIRPILSDKCWMCHGPDSGSRKSKLRLDSEAAVTTDLGNGRRAIVPGRPDESELVKRITSEDELMRMPPVSSTHRLTRDEIGLLVEWVRQGAQWQKHWSFIPPQKGQLPAVRLNEWPKNEIDAFILARLEREGLQPSPEADRATLIRRLSFDLTGLPPTLKEIDDFQGDKSANAYEKVVDRLLASTRFGERMAFRWLDAARYADTNGYQIDGDRYMWRWRDWVIESFNQNKPYDKFVVDQLAGDLMPGATIEQRLATAFNRNHRINAEGGIVPEEYRTEYVIDRVDTTATVFMGLTVGCARCHSHKYDPITHQEYYRLSAYFNNIAEDGRAFDWGNSPPEMAAPDAAQQRRLSELDHDIAAARQLFAQELAASADKQSRWEKSLKPDSNRHWSPEENQLIHLTLDQSSKPEIKRSDKSRHNRVEKKKDDKNFKPDVIGFKDGEPQSVPAPTGEGTKFDGKLYFDLGRIGDFRYKSTSEDFKERFAISIWINPESGNAGSIITKMPDKADEHEAGMPRTGGWGLFFMDGKVHFNMVREWGYDGYRAETENSLPVNQWHHVMLLFDGTQPYNRVNLYVDGLRQTLKINQGNFHLYWGLPGTPLRIGAGGGADMRFKGAMNDLRIYTRIPEDDEIAVLACREPLDKIAGKDAPERSMGEAVKLRNAFIEAEGSKELKQSNQRLRDLRSEKQRFEDSLPMVMIMQEMPDPRPAYLLKRGSYDAPAEKVERGVPAILPAMPPGLPNNRLGLAVWLAGPEHPLTSRVAVNRIWQMLFGTGLVKTTDDFGSQGELPSHPELLDWLAVDFSRGAPGKGEAAWDLKHLIKKIVTSAAYRQSSKISTQLLQRDPENRLVARGPRFRLPAEMIRDQALSIAGLLVEKIGGPSVKPYQPEGLYKDMAFGGLTGYDRDKGEGLWRRSLYTFWKRTILSPNMAVFDASAREFCTVRDTRTNTPLQSLNLMNDVTYIEAARMLAGRMINEGGEKPAQRIAWAFRTVTSRPPSEKELQVLLRNFDKQLASYNATQKESEKLLLIGEKRNQGKFKRNELAAYALTASLILNLDEAVTKQ